MDLKNYQNLVLGMSSIPLLSSNSFVKNHLGPVLYFGRLREAKIVTISINPSDREFIDAKGKPLTGDQKRFETLASLGRTDWNGLTPSEYDKIIDCCDNYFQNNPYTQWFDRLEKIINYSGYSYYDQKVYAQEESDKCCRAAHLDLFCWATRPKWGSLPKADQNNLMNQGLLVLAELLKVTESPNLETIVLNGQTTIDWFNQKTGNSLQPTSKIFIRLSRKGVPQSVTCYEGTISQINGISLGRELKVVGWSCYVQNAFGKVTPGPDKMEKSILGLLRQLHGQTMEEYWAEREKNKPKYLFHGTDAKMVRMTDDERHAFFGSCNSVIDKLTPIITQYELKKLLKLSETGEYWYHGILDTIRCISSMKEGDQRFQYGNLYLTTAWMNADFYAKNSFAGGEFGRFAWCLINVFEYFDNNLLRNLGIGEDIARVKSFSSQPAEPVVFSFALKDLNLDYLRYDTGGVVDWTNFDRYPFYRYLLPLSFDLSQAEPASRANYPDGVY